MSFKRATLAYGDTPQPVTPYQKAAQVWDQRIGSSRAQAHNWRLMALGSLALALVLAAFLLMSGSNSNSRWTCSRSWIGCVFQWSVRTPRRQTESRSARSGRVISRRPGPTSRQIDTG